MDEFGRIAEIRRRLSAGAPARSIAIGIGDDAAVLSPSNAHLALSVDTAIEGVHFRLDWASPEQIGFRSLVGALSDLAAMGATPQAALWALSAPKSLAAEVLYRLADGVAEASALYDAPVVGGNLAASDQLTLTFTVVGECAAQPLTRHGGRAGDALFVTGTLGDAALGVVALQAGRASLVPHCVARWRRPAARITEARAVLGVASAAIDLSDGLLQDLGHLCTASAVGAVVELERLPLSEELRSQAAAFDHDPYSVALRGGEDYELLFAAPVQEIAGATRIGRLVEGSAVRVVNARGEEVASDGSAGFQHF